MAVFSRRRPRRVERRDQILSLRPKNLKSRSGLRFFNFYENVRRINTKRQISTCRFFIYTYLFSALFLFVFERFQLAHKGFKVLKFAVNGRKTNVCHVIERFELFHDQNADMLGGNLMA